MGLFETALFIAAATFIGCAAFWIPLAVLMGRPMRGALQLATGLALLAFLAGLVLGPGYYSDADEHRERSCSGRQC